ncbi:MAG: hypothetical protein LBI03_03775 [Clostridiales bacterium]|jgi:hypothetical protein|nr:hypothetical protein [Clostridiales bacterium]
MEKTTVCLNGKLREGDFVVIAPNTTYGTLIGYVKAINYVGTPEHDEITNNVTDDVLVDFENDYSEQRIKEIEEQFRDLYDDDTKIFDELPLDLVVMAPNELLRIDIEKIGEKYYKTLLDSEARTAAWCFNALQNFVNSQPKAMVYEVVVSYRCKDEEGYQEFQFNTECSAYDCACEQYAKILEKFDGQPNSYRYAGERGDSLFFAGGIHSGSDESDCYYVRLNKYRWFKAEKQQKETKDD